MTDKKRIKLLTELVEVLKKDAEMAISGEWNISGYGLNNDAKSAFEDQISLIEQTFNKINYENKTNN